MTESVLVILGPGLARLVHASGVAAAIRRRHDTARVTAVTSPDAAAFARAMPYFDDVVVDDGAPWWRPAEVRALRRRLRAQPFGRVYDFGDPTRSRFVCRLIHGWRTTPEHLPASVWSRFDGGGMHIVDKMTRQLHDAGIADVPRPDLGWVARTVTSYSAPFKMSEPFALICTDAGSSGALPRDFVTAAAGWYAARELTPVLVGETPRPDLADHVTLAAPRTRDITGRAPAGDLVFLAWGAHSAVGADGGVTTLAATAGCKTVVLCGAGSDPAIDGPRGANVATLQRESIAAISFSEAAGLLERLSARLPRVS